MLFEKGAMKTQWRIYISQDQFYIQGDRPVIERIYQTRYTTWGSLVGLLSALRGVNNKYTENLFALTRVAVIRITWWRHQMETFSISDHLCGGIHRSPVNSPHKGQWRRVLMFSVGSTRTNGWVNNRDAGDLRRHRAHYDATVMMLNSSHLPMGKLRGLLH